MDEKKRFVREEISPEESERIRRDAGSIMHKFALLGQIIKRRYDDCDEQGHLEPDEKNNSCSYCCRHLGYSAPETDSILKSREKLPLYHQPMDAPILMNKRREEIAAKKGDDYREAVFSLMKKLKDLGILERVLAEEEEIRKSAKSKKKSLFESEVL